MSAELSRKQLEEELQIYHSLFENHPDGVVSLDLEGKIINLNPAIIDILGYSPEEISKMSYHQVIDEDYLEIANEYFFKTIKGEPQNYEIVCTRKNGTMVPLKVTSVPMYVEEQVVGFFGIIKDISKEKEYLNLLQENEEKYRSLFENNLDAIIELDLNGNFKDVNNVAGILTGYSKEELLRMNITALITEKLDAVDQKIEEVKSGKGLHLEKKIINKNGEIIDVDIKAVPILINGKVSGNYVIARDITAFKQYQKRIQELAFTDQLTGLPNRHSFYLELQDIITNAQKQRKAITLLTIDFDGFKFANESYGIKTGDQLLVKGAERLKSCIRYDDKIYRIGGDEFIIVVEGITLDEAGYLAHQIITTMNKPFQLSNVTMSFSVCVGICTDYDFTNDADSLIKKADIALVLAKKLGKNHYQYYKEDLSVQIIREAKIEHALPKGIENNEFTLFYQPQVDLQTGKIIGCEALLRWNPAFGTVSPAEFIPIAEQTGYIIPIGEWVIKETCKQIKRWNEMGFHNVTVSFNVSARQFKDPEFAKKVRKIIGEEKVDPNYIEIEITESVMLDVEGASKLIHEFKEMGFKIAIDDFGIGYSSLNVIKNVEIDTLKIDKSLIVGILQSDRMLSILTAIINIGKVLNLNVIIEGIETKEQLELLKPFSVIGQGYYFSRPLRPEQLDDIWDKKWE